MREGKYPNIVFIVIDALRTRNLSCYGYPKKTSPSIDKLAKEAVLFEDAYSCINVTDASLTTIFSGTYPTSHGIVTHGERVPEHCIRTLNKSGIRFLPEILRSKGFETFAIDWLDRWHKRGYDYYSGIEHELTMTSLVKSLQYVSRKFYNFLYRRFYRFSRFLGRNVLRKSTATDYTNEAISIIKRSHARPFLLFVHYWDSHFPYHGPTHYVRKYLSRTQSQGIEDVLKQIDPESESYIRITRLLKVNSVDEAVARYDGAIAYVDHEVGRIVEALDEQGILDETILVLTSDHGESLTEHGIFFSHHGLYDVSIHVPLIIKYPGSPKGKRVKGFVQHFDMVPTIFDVLNMETKSFDFDGKSVIPLVNGEMKELHQAIYADEGYHQRKRCVRTHDYKYIRALSKKGAVCTFCRCVHGGMEELYDLKDDPEETRNIIEEKRKVLDGLKKQLSSWVETHQLKEDSKKLEKVPEKAYAKEEEEKIKERLRKLGYF